MKTEFAKKERIERRWYVIDAQGLVLGRLAAEIAKKLRGKDKPTFSPHMDVGDFIVVVNAAKIRLTGNKLKNKVYYRHTGYPGGIRSINAGELLSRHPERLLEKAVKGMLPKNRLGRQMYKKLKVYTGADHPHAAQQPEVLTFAQRY
ncbi:50S ribosomal protein L13 [candidate division KSB3 bacterium]|uniref:Large ribosomal subunit protein uL13 n=1 Tax=candidate division KSB3 bacterium TaxID=2044937 RepID=A0A2G6E4B4_9BACT|nr:MAG: 50S ribosomal protein L13 [candidate division KSB3 bacterium]PIE29437.1 MAG: 50S ribosomal protein L13 [candidate division KSB3 bacterium]